jgi:hypothetical protein
MSVRIMSEVFERSKTQGNARLVLLSLADSCNDDASCWPSIRKIAEKANICEPITKKYLNALIQIGVISRDERENQFGRQTSNLYKINVEKIGDDEIPKSVLQQVVSPSRVKSVEGVTRVSGGGGNPVQGVEGVTRVSLPIMNHNKEPKIEPSRESSAMASHSSVELNQPNLFPNENTANAKVSFATAHFNDPPNMANAKTTAARKKSPPTNIPTELDTPEFNTAWNEFLQHRKEKRAPMTPTAQKNMFGKFTAWGVASAVAAIDTAISNGWTGVFEPKQNKSNSKPERFSNF